MAKAFLSHSSKNKDIVRKIALQLGVNNCHYDELTFEAGEKTINEIFKGLEDTDIFVLFISNDALESKWVKREITEAKTLISKNYIERIFPLIIDKNITYNDPRIPDWIKKPYNIKQFDNEVLILKKIRQLIREANFRKYSHLKEINDLFVGRNKLLDEFEKKIFNIDTSIPSCIIAYSFFEGMGRKTFLKNSLLKTRIIDKWYEPIYIPLSSKESIEDFIYKLNFIEENTKEIFEYNLSEETVESKIGIAKNLIRNFVQNGEIIFIVDDGGIVLPNTQIVPWFIELMQSHDFLNAVNVCLISKFKPNIFQLRKMGKVAAFQVDELSSAEVQILFIQYLNYLGVEIDKKDALFFLEHLHGIPGQVIYAANLISSVNINQAKQYIQDIVEFDELGVLSVLDFLADDILCKQMLIALSKFEIISYDIIYKIFGENDNTYKSMQKLSDLGLFYNVSSTHQYIKLNSSVSDYITRSKLHLIPEYNDNLKKIINESLEKPLELNENTDYSEFLISLQGLIRSGKTIPNKFFIPSFFLKAIVQEYYNNNYKVVIELAQKILDRSQKFDSQIIRETKYWLCLAYCRLSDERFFEEVKYFNDSELNNVKDFYFLYGFYFRIDDDMDKAEEYFLKVLALNDNHSKTKRELVNVYLRKHEYQKALQLAEDNYQESKSNILHIGAYFTCLVRKPDLSEDDLDMLDVLLGKTQKSMDKRSDEFYSTMVSEYEYYVNGDVANAIKNLTETLRTNKHNFHAYKALSDIYRKIDANSELLKLQNSYPHFAKQKNR